MSLTAFRVRGFVENSFAPKPHPSHEGHGGTAKGPSAEQQVSLQAHAEETTLLPLPGQNRNCKTSHRGTVGLLVAV